MFGRVSHNNLLIFTKQFAQMMKNQLQLVTVLDNLAAETPQRRLRTVIQEVSEEVKHGVDLADALEDHPRVFSEVYVNIVRAGISSGRLGVALAQIAWYLDIMFEISRRTRSALTYPLFVVAAFFAVFNGMIFMILPRFEAMYDNFGQELPGPTQTLLWVGAVWSGNWLLFLGGAAAAGFGFAAWVANPAGRAVWDRAKLAIPLFGPVWRLSALARFLRTMAVQVENDVPLLDAVELAGDSAGNLFVRNAAYEIAASVESGTSLVESFRDHPIFDGIVLQMIAAGEQAGELHPLLMSAAEYFDSLMRDRLDTIVTLINPVLTMIIGIGIAAMMLAAFLPVFELGGVMR